MVVIRVNGEENKLNWKCKHPEAGTLILFKGKKALGHGTKDSCLRARQAASGLVGGEWSGGLVRSQRTGSMDG